MAEQDNYEVVDGLRRLFCPNIAGSLRDLSDGLVYSRSRMTHQALKVCRGADLAMIVCLNP